jgi:membrane protein DedA with SNARE-associated domain
VIDPSPFFVHRGYLTVIVLVALGNVGLPVPEETVLIWAGYLGWTGELRPSLVILVALIGAIGGDNLGYGIGRRCGRAILHRHGCLVGATPARVAAMERLVARYGAGAIFVARFVPGLRVLAGPLAGVTNLPFGRFFIANALGALVFVPLMVGLGYSLGQSVGAYLERLRGTVWHVELLAFGLLLVASIALIGWRRRRSRPPR